MQNFTVTAEVTDKAKGSSTTEVVIFAENAEAAGAQLKTMWSALGPVVTERTTLRVLSAEAV